MNTGYGRGRGHARHQSFGHNFNSDGGNHGGSFKANSRPNTNGYIPNKFNQGGPGSQNHSRKNSQTWGNQNNFDYKGGNNSHSGYPHDDHEAHSNGGDGDWGLRNVNVNVKYDEPNTRYKPQYSAGPGLGSNTL